MEAREMAEPEQLVTQSMALENRWSRRSRVPFIGGNDAKLFTHIDTNCRTMYDAFRRGSTLSKDGPCLGWHDAVGRPYRWLSYNICIQRARNLAAGLIESGVSAGQGSNVGIYAPNCVEWVLVEQGCYCFNMVLVPLYDTLGRDALAFIMEQTEMSTVVVDGDEKIVTLLELRPAHLTRIVSVKPVDPQLLQQAQQQGVQIVRFHEMEKLGAESEMKDQPPAETDVASICYTSGTTGSPKGVIFSHLNLMAVMSACLLHLGGNAMSVGDTYISYLPLAHSLERVIQGCMYITGGAVGFFLGDVRRLLDDVRDLRPTVMPGVPRLLNRIYNAVWAKLSGSRLKTKLLEWALDAKEQEFRRYRGQHNTFWDWLVLGKIRDMFGGSVRLFIVGSAPTSPDILMFIRCVLGCTVVEGYGLTETTAPCTLAAPGDWRGGHVGAPLPCCHVKLVDVPDMEYSAEQGRGEVCVRGANVFSGYYRDPERTREALDDQGWFHSGDIGEWLPNGTLRIIDRRKHIFKLAQGEYISPDRIENVYAKCKYVAQTFIYGESLKSCLVGIVVPDETTLRSQMSSTEGRSMEELCQDPQVKQLIMEDMAQMADKAELKGFEKVKDIYLHPEIFGADLLTPTMKSKRPVMQRFFQPQLSSMYSQLD